MLFDRNYKKILDENWWDMRGFNPWSETINDGVYGDNITSWSALTIPIGQEIIGVKMHRDIYGDIKRLGF